MVNVNIIRHNDIIESMSFNGHAMFDDYGKDIVCASISSSMLTTVNAIIEFDSEAISYEEGKEVTIKNLKKDNTTNVLLDNLYKVLIDLEKQYPKNIKINEEEN